jgi:hypothetical protein
VRVVLTIGGSGRALALTVRSLLQAQAESVAREIQGGRPLPKLYQSRVRYRPERARGSGVEFFDDPWEVLARGHGDCDDLVCWRVAELLAANEPASVICQWRLPRYHVAVRRADGSAEDPSRHLIQLYGRH